MGRRRSNGRAFNVGLALVTCLALAACSTAGGSPAPASPSPASAQPSTPAPSVAEGTQTPSAAAETPSAAAETPKPDIKGQEITVLMPPWDIIPESVVKGFQDATGVKVTLASAEWADIAQKVAIAGAAGSYVADIVESEPYSSSGFWRAGWFLPLETRLDSSVLKDIEADQPSFSSGGHLYGAPNATDFRIVMYNQQLFKNAGIAEPPTTLDQLSSAAQAMKAAGKPGAPIGMTLDADENTSVEWFALTLANGGEILDANYHPAFTDPGSAGYKAFKFMIDSFKQGLITSGATNDKVDQMVNHFLAGDSAWILSGPSQPLVANDPKQSKIAGAAALSLVPGSSHSVFSLDEGIGIPYTAKHPDAAAAFIDYFLKSDSMLAVCGASGTLPSTTSGLAAFNAAGKIPFGDVVAQQAALKVPLFKSGIPAWYPIFSEKVYTMIQAAAVGTVTVDEAISQIAKTAEQLASGG